MFKTKKWMEIIRLKNGWKSFMSMICEQGRETIVLAYFSVSYMASFGWNFVVINDSWGF